MKVVVVVKDMSMARIPGLEEPCTEYGEGKVLKEGGLTMTRDIH